MEKTRAIVLRSFKYTDSSLIVDCLTERFGRLSCIVSGVKGGKARMKAGFFQPAQMVELIIYMKQGRDLQRLKEVSPYYIYDNLPYQVVKSAVGQFVIEVVMHAVSEPEENRSLYSFVEQTLQYIDTTSHALRNIPIHFAWNLTDWLGFAPNLNTEESMDFDLREGVSSRRIEGNMYSMPAELADALCRLLNCDFADIHEIKLGRRIREELLHYVQLYYQLHIEKFKPLQSPEIFQAIFRSPSS